MGFAPPNLEAGDAGDLGGVRLRWEGWGRKGKGQRDGRGGQREGKRGWERRGRGGWVDGGLGRC